MSCRHFGMSTKCSVDIFVIYQNSGIFFLLRKILRLFFRIPLVIAQFWNLYMQYILYWISAADIMVNVYYTAVLCRLCIKCQTHKHYSEGHKSQYYLHQAYEISLCLCLISNSLHRICLYLM